MENRVRAPGLPEGEPRQARPAAERLVAFDFDGTLTVHDTYTAFMLWRTRGPARVCALIRLLPAALAYLAHRDRGRIKAAATRVFLGGVPASLLAADAERFAAQAFARLMRPDALATLAQRQAAGDRVIIVTASPELIIAPFAARLGAEALIGTRLQVDAHGEVTGDFDGENCRGQEKVRRITRVFGPVRLAAAYGDTAGDREMLAMADQPYMKVFKSRPQAG